MEPDKGPPMFDAYYFATGCGRPYQRDDEWMRFFGQIADRIVSDIRPETVLDAGCAWGFLVEALRARNVAAYGIDVSEYAIQNIHPDVKPYCWVGSVVEPFPQVYDLIVCIEVLEHLPQEQAEKAVINFCRHSQDILFSSTPFDYKEATHFNVQPPEYWAELFARQGFYRDVDFDGSFITSWAVRFRRKDEPLPRMVREYERRYFLLSKENADLRGLTVEMRNEISALREQVDGKEQLVQAKDRQIQEISAKAVELDRQANTARDQLNEILASRSWQLLQKAQRVRLRLAPPGSLRERLLIRRGK
jgi:hypothetical protein